MDLLDRIRENTVRIAGIFSESAVAASILVCIFGIATMIAIRGLTNGLFEMHRSRSKIKKTRSKYSFIHRLVMMPAWYECIHAKSFCRFLIIVHHLRFLFLLFSLVLAIMSNDNSALLNICSSFSAIVFFAVDIPFLIFHVLMDRYPFQRLKHEYRFRKYHNTKDHDSLF